ncbi:MAG: hypothetical protein FJW39_19365 [Acidobacteria bacterium]|nr:hypothetical protein [Acidobacteriota bacterium]
MNNDSASGEVEEMRSEYDLASMKGAVRGKYAGRTFTNLVVIHPELVEAFPDSDAVNAALRAVLEVSRTIRQPKKRNSKSAVRSR